MADNSEKFKTELFKKIGIIMDKQDELVEKYNKSISIIAMFEKILDGIEYDFGKEIPRIAVSFNNKIVELGSFFKKRDLDFFDSQSMAIIVPYFEDLLTEGTDCLDSLMVAIKDFYDNIMSPQKRKENCKKIEDLISHYRELDSKIYFFDIEKDITKLVDSNKDTSDLPYKNQMLRNLNYELKSLGFEIRFQIDSKTSSKEYDDLFTDPSDAINIYYQQVEKIERHFKDNNIEAPFIIYALKERLLDHFHDAIHYISIDDIKHYLIELDAMKNFDIMGEIVESVGRHVSLWDSIYKENDDWSKTKIELEKMGLSDLIPQIEYDINAGKYDEYVQKRIDISNQVIADEKNNTQK